MLPDHFGLPLLVSSHAALASPSDQAYAGVDAAVPFGTNSTNRLWVRHLQRMIKEAQCHRLV